MKPIIPIRALCLWMSLSVGISGAWAADNSASAPYRSYSVAEGLAQSEVHDIAQDQAGYLWVATAGGLNRYDGETFNHYTVYDGLPTNSLTAIYADTDNSIFVGDTGGGVSILRGSRVERTIAPYSDTSSPVVDIEVVGNDILAVVTGIGILRTSSTAVDAKWELIGNETMGIEDLVVFGTDIWVVSTTGLYSLTFGGGAKLTLLSDSVTRVHVDSTGTVWLADSENRIGNWEGGQFVPRIILDSADKIVSIATDADQVVWVATETELFSVDGSSVAVTNLATSMRHLDGLRNVNLLFVDRENSVWLVGANRLIRYFGSRFRHYTLRTGEDEEYVWAITEDAQGRFWFGTDDELILLELDQLPRTVGADFGVPEGAVRDVVTDAQGNIWFGVADKGLFRLAPGSMVSERIGVTGGREILDIGIAPDGAIWFSTDSSGIFRYSAADGELLQFDVAPGKTIYTLDIAADGSVWYGVDKFGVVHLVPTDDGLFQPLTYGRESGLEDKLFDHVNVMKSGRLWVATEDGGLYRFIAGEFVNYGLNTPFADQLIYIVEELDNEMLVVGTERGLHQLIPGEANVSHFGQSSGFVGVETNIHASFFDSAGDLWIGTVNGATRMDVTQAVPTYVEPSPAISSASTALDRLPIVDNGDVKPDQLGVRIEFAAVSLLNPRGIEYSYRLIGAEEPWSAATKNRTVSYPRIGPGTYEFMVRARSHGGEWSREFASIRFTVLPHFWQQSWFVLAAILAFLLAIWAAMVSRTRNIERQNKALLTQVEERTRSIEEAKQRLEQGNWRLSREVESRQKSDLARAEVETRFRRAFENAPIGMGLLDADGKVFDANPALLRMFWSGEQSNPQQKFANVVDTQDRERFELDYQKVTQLSGDELDKKFACKNSKGDIMQTLVSLSSVATDEGGFAYAVLQVQDVTESLKLTSQLEYQASYDELTGLLNRRAFEAELQRAWDKGTSGKGPSHLMFMDLDQFKVVNDTSGHSAGDELLKAISKILHDNVRGNDVVARLGGDEFGILLWDCPAEVAQRIAESIRADIEDFRFHWDTETYRIGISIGGLPVERSFGDVSELQQLADAACYAAKEGGRNQVHMVAESKNTAQVHRGQVRWVQRLREAMDQNRFAIYAQVFQALQAGQSEPEQVEILLRLRDPVTRKLIPPGAFVPAAERYGLSVELDQWVVGNLLTTLFVHDAFEAERRAYWINLSGTSIGDKRFALF